MKLRVFSFVVLIASLAYWLVACSGSEFSGDAASENSAAKRPNKVTPVSSPVSGPVGGDTPSQPSLDVDDNGQVVIRPQACDATTISFVFGSGQCPAGSAAYAIDDNKSPFVACCPLPASDILAKDGVISNKSTCATNEIAVGVSASGLMCAPINQTRYSLGAATATCYLGSGSSGGRGSAKCGAPTATISAMTSKFGSDACVPQPFGSLVMSRTGKDCRNMRGSELKFKDSGQPVTMFK